MQELTQKGLLHTTPTNLTMLRVAAALVFFIIGSAAGYIYGSRTQEGIEAMEHAVPQFVLLLHEIPNPAEDAKAMIAEYGGWAGGLAQKGMLVAGEKLMDSGRLLSLRDGGIDVAEGRVVSEGRMTSGYFIISAPDYSEAVKIASTCPHLKYGGTVEVRQIEPT